MLARGESLWVPTLDRLPAEAAADKGAYRNLGVRSFLIIPILTESLPRYAIAISAHEEVQLWPSDYIPRLGADKRIKAIEMNPEMASLDITIPRMITFGGKESIFITTLPEIEYGAKVMLERGVKPELEVFNPVLMEDVYSLIEKGL
jgi:hypothetical protein